LDHQNNYVEATRTSKLFAALLITLECPNYFDSPTKLFSNLYLAKFLFILLAQKLFFGYVISVT